MDVAGDVEYLYLDDALTGTVHIGGDLIDCCLYGIPSSGELLIDGDLLGMTLQPVFGGSSLRGRIEIGGDFDAIVYLGSSRSLAGELVIGGDFGGSIDTWYGEVSGTVHVGGDFIGSITTYSADVSGDIVIDGDLTGGIGIGMSPAYLVEPALTGTVTVQGNMTGVISIYGDLRDPTDPNDPDPQLSGGHIIINGSFGTPQYVSAINIGGTMSGPRPFVAVDYDGWDQPDNWEWWGFVQIFAPDPNDPNAPPLMLRGNTPAWHVWEITQCRGDMNNDGAVDVGDINPFIQALTSVRSYSLAFPGLGALEDPWDPNAGSRVYHGDCNCDGFFDVGDINPFILRLNQGCCWEQCGNCPGGNGLLGGPPGGLPEPEDLAAKLAVNVKPELFDDLVALAAAAASVQTDPQLKVYWEKVHHALAP